MSQELFVSVGQLVEMASAKGSQYDHVVIESSGISEPKSVRSVFQDAESYGLKLMDEASGCFLPPCKKNGVLSLRKNNIHIQERIR